MYSPLNRFGNRMRLALCLLLSVSSWRGPIPILHCHQHLTDPELLQHHEDVCHEGRSSDKHHGFHWHLAFPEDVNGKRCPDTEPIAPELAVLACAQALNSCQHAELQRTLFDGSADAFVPAVAIGQTRSQLNRDCCRARSFLESLAGYIPLVAITGVCLV